MSIRLRVVIERADTLKSVEDDGGEGVRGNGAHTRSQSWVDSGVQSDPIGSPACILAHPPSPTPAHNMSSLITNLSSVWFKDLQDNTELFCVKHDVIIFFISDLWGCEVWVPCMWLSVDYPGQ